MKHIFDSLYEQACVWDDVSSTTSTTSSLKSTHCDFTPPRHKKRRRGVTFFQDAFVYDVERHADSQSIWYSKEEIRLLKQQAKQIIYLAQQGRLLEESDHHTYHGLDKFVWSAWTNQKSIKHLVLDAVLTEQVRQYNTYGRVDSDSLRVVYQKTMENFCLSTVA